MTGGSATRVSAGADGDGLVTRLEDVATLAFHGVPGCDAASVTVAVGGGRFTAGATSSAAREFDAAQQELVEGPCLTALRQGHVVRVDDYRLDRRWPHVGRAAAEHGVRSSLSLPMLHRGFVLGVLNLYGQQPAALGRWAGHVGGVLARHAAVAVYEVEKGRRTSVELGAQKRIARALQHDMLPAVPTVPGIVTAARYVPAESSAEVGGDWYDIFPLPHRAIGVAVGDVMGHGLSAAGTMNQLRTALRCCAYGSLSPADALDRLDRLVRGFDLALTTAIYATVVLQEGGAVLQFCNAGHPPPLLRSPEGRVQQLNEGASWLLGGPTEHLGPRSDAAVWLPSGAALILYTDGLVERRPRDRDLGIGSLCAALSSAPARAHPDALCDRLLDASRGAGYSDDLAVLVMQVS